MIFQGNFSSMLYLLKIGIFITSEGGRQITIIFNAK